MTELVLTETEARELTAQIYGALEVAWNLIVTAYRGRAWEALDYKSWDAYCQAEFNGSRLKLPREDRQEVVASLRDAGMSTRAITSAMGIDRETVLKDIRQVVGNQPLAPANVVGLNGKTYQARRTAPKVIDADVVDIGQPFVRRLEAC